MYKKTILKSIPLSVAVLLLPAYAFADAGTPLMWFTMLHLAIGNLIIGLAEGALIILIYKTRKLATLLIMVLANYASMLAGFTLIDFVGVPIMEHAIKEAPLYIAPKALVAMIFVSYLLTIILEWPFCLWILKSRPRRLMTSLAASAIVQTASYAVIVPMYLLVSPVSLYTNVKLDPSLSFANNNATVYYISEKDGSINSVRTNGSKHRKVLDTKITDGYARLFISNPQKGKDKELWVKGYPDEKSATLLIKDFTDKQTSVVQSDGNTVQGTWFDFEVKDLRPAEQKDLTVQAGFWAAEGLSVRDKTGKNVLSVALETPFIAWYPRNVTVLPGDQVVYQLDDRIVLLDIRKRKIGLLTTGRGPTVVLDK
jgi:hypothetical protein